MGVHMKNNTHTPSSGKYSHPTRNLGLHRQHVLPYTLSSQKTTIGEFSNNNGHLEGCWESGTSGKTGVLN